MATVIKTIIVNGLDVIVSKQPFSVLSKRNKFNGQKIFHPFKTMTVSKVSARSGKTVVPGTMGSSAQRAPTAQNEFIYTNQFDEEFQKDIRNGRQVSMKHDGGCGFLFWDTDALDHIPYRRLDIKKNDSGKFPDPPKGAILCEPRPTHPDATHWTVFVRCTAEEKSDKWIMEAFKLAKQSGKLEGINQSFTVEFMGKKFNYKPCDGVDVDAAIVPHGLVTLDIPDALFTYEGILQILEALPFMEGLIVHGAEHVWKIRRDMFYDGKDRLPWPTKSTEQISMQVALL
jgi:hypothetical protein